MRATGQSLVAEAAEILRRAAGDDAISLPMLVMSHLLMMTLVVAMAGCDRSSGPIVTPTGPTAGQPTPPVPPPPPPPLRTPARIAGEYTLTLTASDTCTMLPEWSRTRSYDAVIDQEEGAASATIRVISGDFHSWFAARFNASVDGDSVSFGIDNQEFAICSESWFEALSPEGFLYVCGSAGLTASGSAIAGNLNGTVGYEAKEGVYSTAVDCRSLDHRMTFQRK